MRRVRYLIAVLLLCPLAVEAQDNLLYEVDVKVRMGVKADVDTIWTGLPVAFEYYYENEVTLYGFCNWLQLHSPDGAIWDWGVCAYDIRYTYDPGCNCMVPDTGWGTACLIPGSRADNVPDFAVWLTGDRIGTSPDNFYIYTVSPSGFFDGLPPGSFEPIVTVPVTVTGPADDEVKTVCIDIYQKDLTDVVPYPCPGTGVEDGEKADEAYLAQVGVVTRHCWPVKQPPKTCGDANFDQAVNIGDAVFLINHVFRNGADPLIDCCADANGDGEINVGDAVFLVNYVFRNGAGPTPCCQWE